MPYIFPWTDGYNCVPHTKGKDIVRKNYLHARNIHCCKTAICGYKHKGAGYGMTIENIKHVTCPRCKKLVGLK